MKNYFDEKLCYHDVKIIGLCNRYTAEPQEQKITNIETIFSEQKRIV